MQFHVAPVLGLISLSLVCFASDLDAGRIAAAQKTVQNNPKVPQGYIDLASALCRQARDSEDPATYDKASVAVDRALELSPGNHDALKLRVMVLLGRHDFVEALKRSRKLNRKVPDDTAVWGYMVDANLALGDYAEAEKDAQWILDLRRGSTLGFIKAAALREMFGDIEGAVQFYDEALLRTSPNDVEERAWLITQTARLQLAAGNPQRARELLAKAVALNPDSQFTRGVLANLKAAEGNYAEAISLCRQRFEKTPNADNLYALAVMLEKGGKAAEAEAAFRKFETQARAEMPHTFNANRDLIFYYADRRNSAVEALAIAVKDAETRHDSETLDSYAWALFRSGKVREAEKQMDGALAPGVRDGEYFCHALQIAAAAPDPAAVKRFQKELSGMPAAVCPVSSVASK